MTEVTVLFLDATFSSTATGPMEVFRHAGTLWNILTGKRPVQRFRVTTASADGRAVRCDGDIKIQPDAALADIRKTDLIFIPTTGLSIDDVVERNAQVVPFLRRWHKRGAAIASVCSGVGLVAATGLLDGKRATTHWALAERFREKYPKVKWMPELMVTEDHGFYCGGGVHAALDLSLYLVEQFCGHEVAMQSAKAMLIEMPRAWQAGFAIVPLKTEHSDDSISSAQEWLHQNFQQDLPARSPGPARRHEPAQFRPPLQASHRRQPADLLAEAARRRRQAPAGERPSHHAGNQRRRRLSGCRLFPPALPTPHRSLPQRLPAKVRGVRLGRCSLTTVWLAPGLNRR